MTTEAGRSQNLPDKRREISPYINRFLQPDTIIPDPSNPQSWNRYSYGLNSPLVYADPSGHDPILFLLLAAVVILTAACAPKSPEPTPQVVPTIPSTLPISGYERPRGEWSGDKLRVSATCYAYALDLTKDPRDGTDWVRGYSLQPGEISGNQITYGADWKTIIDAATSDLKKLGRTLTYSSSDEACPSGSYKIALAIDPLNNDNFNELYDFHFYRQDQDGGWSSKHGHAFVED